MFAAGASRPGEQLCWPVSFQLVRTASIAEALDQLGVALPGLLDLDEQLQVGARRQLLTYGSPCGLQNRALHGL